MNKHTLCDGIAQQRDVSSALYLQNKDSNKIAMARRESKEEGIAEGKHKKAMETAKNLFAMGLSVAQISKATGLSIDEIKELM